MAETNLCDDEPLVRIEDLTPYVAVRVDMVPSEVIGHALRLSAIEFASRTKAVKRTMFLDLQECVQHYALAHTDCYSIMAIESVCMGATPLRATSVECCMGGGCWYAYERPASLYIGLSPGCDQPRALEIRAVVIPGQDSCFLDEWVYQQHAEAIASGAVYRLLAMQDEEWFNPAMASLAAREFNAGVRRAITLDRSHNSTAPQVARMPRGFFV